MKFSFCPANIQQDFQSFLLPLQTLLSLELFMFKYDLFKKFPQAVFREEYDKVKIKEYINLMKEQEDSGRIVDVTESYSDHQFFQNG